MVQSAGCERMHAVFSIVKKKFILMVLLMSGICLSAQNFVLPPELKWWLYEIQKIDEDVRLDEFKFSEERFILEEDVPVSFKNKLYPVLKKWNYFGNQFAYCSILSSLKKEKSGKYSIQNEVESELGIFDRDENCLFVDFFGSSKGIDAFAWLTDKRIIATGKNIGDGEVDFIIYDYILNDAKITVREYSYTVKNVDVSKLKLKWTEQRNDYFE